MKRFPWLKVHDNPPGAPHHDWMRMTCTRCGGSILASGKPKNAAVARFVKLHSKCEARCATHGKGG